MKFGISAPFSVCCALVATSLFAGDATTQTGDQPQTRSNLQTALHGEAYAFVKYSLFAEQARREGHADIAAQFEAAAKKERHEHFAELAALYELVGTTEQNLKDAIAGETSEATSIYPNFAATALSEGNQAAAALFEELAGDERTHAAEFSAALSSLREAQGGAH